MHEHSVTLKFGYHDKKNQTISKDVTFGKRLTGSDLMRVDGDRNAQGPTKYIDLIRSAAITKFGDLRMPVPLHVLLNLNKIDRSLIGEAFEEFQQAGRGDRSSEFRPGNIVKLYFGFKVDDIVYDLVEFSRLPTGLDEVEADNLGYDGLTRELFLLGKQVSKLSSSEVDSLTFDGQIGLDLFNDLDADDITQLRIGGQLAESFFRITGGSIPEEQEGPAEPSADEGDGAVGTGSDEPAAPETE